VGNGYHCAPWWCICGVWPGIYVFVEMYVSELTRACLGICVYIASMTNKDVWDNEKEKYLLKKLSLC